MSRQKSLLVICKVLRLFVITLTADNTYCHLIRENLTQPSKVLGLLVNTLTADDKFPLLNRDNFIHPIQMQLSQKQKKFAQFFSAVLKFKLNFEFSQKKDDTHSLSISEITDSEERG